MYFQLLMYDALSSLPSEEMSFGVDDTSRHRNVMH